MNGDDETAVEVIKAVEAASDNLQELGLDDMPAEPVDDDQEYFGENTGSGGKKKQSSWLGKLGKGISKRVGNVKAALTGGKPSAEDEEILAKIMACRHPFAVKEGGIGIQDPEEAKICRSVLSMMISSMGRKLLQGGNVMKTSFPIQCCQPRTILEVASCIPQYFHAFLPRAVECTDPVERMNLVVACFVSSQILTSANFMKPLNPILGKALAITASLRACVLYVLKLGTNAEMLLPRGRRDTTG